jgi:hypothetical protein
LTNLGLAVTLILSFILRLTGIDWDGFYHLHPDERYIVWVGTTIEFPDNWSTAFDPDRSTFNPFAWPPNATSGGIKVPRGEPRSFAYGHWPLYLGVVSTQVLAKGETWVQDLPSELTLIRDLLNAQGRIEYHHLLIVGRALAALFDTFTVSLVFLIGRRLYGPWVGLLAATLTACTVLHIQQAHFFVTDPFLTTAVVAAIYWMIRITDTAFSQRWRAILLAGALVGLAVGAKFSAVMLVIPLAVAVAWMHRPPPMAKGTRLSRRLSRWWLWSRRPLMELLLALLAGAIVFAVTNPFALLDSSCDATLGGWDIPLTGRKIPPISVNSCYLENIGTQGAMVRGGTQIPFTFQYIGTPKYLYYLDQMSRWGQGVPLAVAGFAGLIWAVVKSISRSYRPKHGEMVLLAWVIPFFFVTGSFQVKFLRYLLPLTPFLSIYAAALLVSFSSNRTPPHESEVKRSRFALFLGTVPLLGVILFSALWAVTFVGLYTSGEHPWIAASRWLHQNVAAGSTIATEHWDYALPVRLTDVDRSQMRTFNSQTLEWYNVEDRLGRESRRIDLSEALQLLADSDYLVLASNRLYGVIPRLPTRYPEVSAYYRLLMTGDLGWDLVHWSVRYPSLGSLSIINDTFAWPHLVAPKPFSEEAPAPISLNLGPADESFTVYDHPLVLIFKNESSLTVREMEKLIRDHAAGDASRAQ